MTRIATRSSLLLASMLVVSALSAQNNVAVNNTGAAPDASAILDVNSTFTGASTRGMLIPRVASTASVTVNASTDGMLVYQTGATPGYYYYNATIPAWVRVQSGADGWEIWGNVLTAPAQQFFGTKDNQDVVFRTNNVERMRMDNAGDLGVGVAAPAEKLDVGGALRLHSSAFRTVLGAPASPVGSNNIYSATDGLGVIEYQRDTVRNALSVYNGSTWSGHRLLWPGHWGNTTGTGVTATGNGPNSGGWRRLNNDYTEVFNAPFSVHGDPVCTPGGTSEIPSPAVVPGVTTRTTALPPATRPQVTPYEHILAQRRMRMQFMFLRNELNPEFNQLYGINGTPSPGANQGLCAGQPITTIAFYIDTALSAAIQKNWVYTLTIKHAPAGLSNLSGGFDNSIDAAAGCLNQTVAQARPTVGNGWDVFTLTTPFVWDGVRNVIVELSYQYGTGGAATKTVPVKFYNVPGTAPANQLTYSSGGTYIGMPAACGNTIWTTAGAYSPCITAGAQGVTGSGMPSTTCGTAMATNARPCIRWGGTVAAQGAVVSGNGPYIQYPGGLVVEDPATPPSATVPNWGWMTAPYYAFKGPGTLSAQKGVYDNGVRLNDHVFDRAFDGRVKPEEAAVFGDRRNLSITEMSRHIETERHLPTIKGRSDWAREGSFSLGDLANQLWTTTETQALYLTELNDRLNVIELLVDGRPIRPDEFELARTTVAGMGDLTEQQKASLMEDLRTRLAPATNDR